MLVEARWSPFTSFIGIPREYQILRAWVSDTAQPIQITGQIHESHAMIAAAVEHEIKRVAQIGQLANVSDHPIDRDVSVNGELVSLLNGQRRTVHSGDCEPALRKKHSVGPRAASHFKRSAAADETLIENSG